MNLSNKTTISLFIFLGMLVSFVFAVDEFQLTREHPLIVTSGEANYDGQDIVLVGDVSVQHSLGKILAKNLSIHASKLEDKKNKFSLMNICDHVQIEFYKGGKLYCSQALVDYEKMIGTFSGTPDQPDVIYTNVGEQGDSQSTLPLLEIKSPSFSIVLVKEPISGLNYAYTLVDHITSNDRVEAKYVAPNQTFLLKAGQALYQKLATLDPSTKEGLLKLNANEEMPLCLLQTLNGDQLEAREIQLNSSDKQLSMVDVKGTLSLDKAGLSSQSLELASDKLLWDDQNQSLSLFGQVSITQNGTIQIKTDNYMKITLGNLNHQSFLRSVHIPQRTEIVYLDASKKVKHRMSCPGSLMMDHEKQEVVLKGIEEASDMPESHQVYIDDELGELYADEVRVNYDWVNHELVPSKIELKGNVRLLNRFDGHVQESASILHYAIADQIDYFPKTFEMLLRGNEKSQVLFFDKVNQIQMSASSLKISMNPTTRKEFIQGIGDVRFTFLDQELEQIKKRFHL
ncbi:MAG: hypothetical protein Q8K60_01465, partial [Parachlamydiaceae bacterium]|nr:hypothetical protein [Parachlamydiaceae bacterium]